MYEKVQKLSPLSIKALEINKDKTFPLLAPLVEQEWQFFSNYKDLDFDMLWPDNLPDFGKL